MSYLQMLRQSYVCWLLQVFLMMMCSLKYGVFIFFGAWQTVALIFTLFLLPETRGVPIERVRCLAACLLRSLCCLVTATAGDGLTHVQFRVVVSLTCSVELWHAHMPGRPKLAASVVASLLCPEFSAVDSLKQRDVWRLQLMPNVKHDPCFEKLWPDLSDSLTVPASVACQTALRLWQSESVTADCQTHSGTLADSRVIHVTMI